MLLAVSSLVIDMKNMDRDEKIAQLEKELQELKRNENENDTRA